MAVLPKTPKPHKNEKIINNLFFNDFNNLSKVGQYYYKNHKYYYNPEAQLEHFIFKSKRFLIRLFFANNWSNID